MCPFATRDQVFNAYGEVVHLVGDDMGDVGDIVCRTLHFLPSATPRFMADLVILARAEAETGGVR